MIPHALCAGAGLPLCQSCERNLDRYTAQQQARYLGRISPSTRGARCDAWRHAPPLRVPTGQEPG